MGVGQRTGKGIPGPNGKFDRRHLPTFLAGRPSISEEMLSGASDMLGCYPYISTQPVKREEVDTSRPEPAQPRESGDERARTANPGLAKPVLSQLSYVPLFGMAIVIRVNKTTMYPNPGRHLRKGRPVS